MATKETPAVEQNATTNTEVHPLKRSYTLISTKHVDYENLTAFEAVTMTLVLFMAVFIGVMQSTYLV